MLSMFLLAVTAFFLCLQIQKRQRWTEEVTRGLGDAIEAHLHTLILLILLYILCSLLLRFVG